MSDIRSVFLGLEQGVDYALAALGLELDDSLETAVIMSLFTDRRAEDDDRLPFGESDRRGWWGDAYADVPSRKIGSRLWLLEREKQLPEVLVRAREYALEALQWLVDDGRAARVDVEASFPRTGVLGLEVTLWLPAGGSAKHRVEYPSGRPLNAV